MQRQKAAVVSVSQTQTSKRPVAYAFAYVNSPRTKEQYPKHLRMFFDHIGLEPVTPPDAKKNVKTTREQSERRKQKFMEELEKTTLGHLNSLSFTLTITSKEYPKRRLQLGLCIICSNPSNYS